MIRVYTHRVNMSVNNDILFIDVTARAKHPLAPPWGLVMGLKRGRIRKILDIVIDLS